MSAFFWDDLLEYIDERRVVSILGPELLRVPQEGGETLLHRWLAEKLTRKLSVPADNLPAAQPLNHVVCRFLERGGQREDIYSRLRAVMKEVKSPTPEPLRKLARIQHFKLYVSTTFDSLLQQALNEARFAGAATVSPTARRSGKSRVMTKAFCFAAPDFCRGWNGGRSTRASSIASSTSSWKQAWR